MSIINRKNIAMGFILSLAFAFFCHRAVSPKKRERVEGIVMVGFENQILVVPAEGNAEYWLAGDDDLISQFPTIGRSTHYKVILDGASKSGGPYGHMDGFDKIFYVTRIIESKKLD